MQMTAVTTPRPVRALRATFVLNLSFILRRRRTGKAARMTSLRMEKAGVVSDNELIRKSVVHNQTMRSAWHCS